MNEGTNTTNEQINKELLAIKKMLEEKLPISTQLVADQNKDLIGKLNLYLEHKLSNNETDMNKYIFFAIAFFLGFFLRAIA